MTTLLDISANRIILRHTNGRVPFDTNEKLFQVTDYVTGSHVAPSRTATFENPGTIVTPIDIDLDTTLASINAHADTVVGVMKITTTDTRPSLKNKGWFNAGGTYLFGLDAICAAVNAPSSIHHYVAGARAFTFFAASGSLKINERSVSVAQPRVTSPITVTTTWPSITIDYKLYCGSFV